ncbi:MAG: hypothetical protein ABI647_22790 [Gemmatimonadota bacterium]
MAHSKLALLGLLVAGCHATGPDGAEPIAKGDRHFGIHVTQASDNDYLRAFQAARATGMDMLPLALSWTEVETPSGWDFATLDLIASFFGSHGLPLFLTITSPINTIVATVPSAYQGMAYDDPRLIAGFNRLLDSVRVHLSNVRIDVLILGNEIDATLGTDPGAWARYQAFFEATAARARQLWGQTLVGATITRDGLDLPGVGAAVDRLIAASDLASLTYYPLATDLSVRSPTVAADDVAHVVGRIVDRPIYFQEVGYPTSPMLGSSEDMQRQFATEVFKAWDRYPTRIKYFGWLWLTDLSAQQTDDLIRYYGLGGSPLTVKFGEYLRTLGLRRYDGAGKSAYATVTELLQARGW